MADSSKAPLSWHTPVQQFLEPSKYQLGAIDLNSILKVFSDNWIQTVRDLKLLSEERCLNQLPIPDSVKDWINSECTNRIFAEKAISLKEYKFTYDGRSNHGICEWMGQQFGKKPWQNPAKLGHIVVRYSSIMHDSAPANELLGHATLRIVTKPDPKSWFSFDFGSRKIKPTAYMIRHYLSWDTEALRSWRFEGSLDGRRWEIIKEHKGDSSLRKKGQECVWQVQSDKYFKHFRIFQTGPNSNRHHYLAMSGFDIWGSVKDANNGQKYAGSSENVFVFEDDFDQNGIIWWLGTRKGNAVWKNPATLGAVRVIFSSMSEDSEPARCAVGQAVVRCVSEPKANSWLCIDLLNIQVEPTHYSIRHYSSFDTECLRNWELQGSNDSRNGVDGRWENIMVHVNDTGLEGAGSTFTWHIPPDTVKGRRWSKFRIFQTGANSNNHHYLSCSGFELYGTVHDAASEGDKQAVAHRQAALEGDKQAVARRQQNGQQRQEQRQEGGRKEGDGGDGRQGPPSHRRDDKAAKRFRFQTPGDVNGLVYHLGSSGGRRQFKNPALDGKIKVTASSVMNDSHPLTAVVGLESVRCVTKPQENSWICVDFGKIQIHPSHYSIRHYSSWDTEALRHWMLEGSRDGVHWQKLRVHDNDTELQMAGQWGSWSIPAGDTAFSKFRIRMLGPNSNNHWYLSCSGFEIYGNAKGPGVTDRQSQQRPPLQREQMPQQPQRGQPLFQYQSDLDTNGLFYYLGTKGHTQQYQNPALIGEVTCRGSALMADSDDLITIVGREEQRIVSKPMRGAFIIIQLEKYVCRPNAYTLRHYKSWDTEALRNWRFEGSLDGKDWVTIREHRNDTSLNTKSQPHTWRVEAAGYFSKFRIYQFDKNSNHHLYLALSSIEIYGDVARQHTSLAWTDQDPASKSQFLAVDARRNAVMNSGSKDSWQTVKSKTPIKFDANGQAEFSVLVEKSENTTNSWRFIAGIAPKTFSCAGNKQWLGSQGSWGYIAGTGGKCHNAGKSEGYAAKWILAGNLVTVRMDAKNKHITFILNGQTQGPAFTSLDDSNGLFAAISMTGKGSRVRLMERITHHGGDQPNPRIKAPAPKPPRQRVAKNDVTTWNPNNKSKQLIIHSDGRTVENAGSNDTWTCIVGNKSYDSGVQSFEIVMTNDARSTNTWKSIVGLVPAKFRVAESAWLGSQDSWGYIGGTGGKCHKVGKSEVYGREFSTGTKVRVQMDFNRRTIEFFLNGKSQGIAFTNLVGPVMPAMSLTGTGSVAKLKI